jgi:hypothetical protein
LGGVDHGVAHAGEVDGSEDGFHGRILAPSRGFRCAAIGGGAADFAGRKHQA